jgi:hypothetical protein
MIAPALEAPPLPQELQAERGPTGRPEKDGEFRYEIRSTFEEYDRVARESELTRV